MEVKYENLVDKYKETLHKISVDAEAWKSFLESASYTYMQPFQNQVVLHLYRPGVKAVATKQAWQKLNRSVASDVQGLPVLNEDNSVGRVFDYQDTRTVGNPGILPWTVHKNKSGIALHNLLKRTGEKSLSDYVHKRVTAVLISDAKQSAPPELQECLEQSVQYVLLSRLGLEVDNLDTSGFAFASAYQNRPAALERLGHLLTKSLRQCLMPLRAVAYKMDMTMPAPEPQIKAPAISDTATPVLQEETTAPTESVLQQTNSQKTAVEIPINGEWTKFQTVAEAEQAALEEYKAGIARDAKNFTAPDEQAAPGGPKARFQDNINALRLLQHLEANGLQATPEQQQLLARYVGWGGLAEVFDARKDNWSKEYQELKELLPEAEYEAARASTLTSYYTSPEIIRAMYSTLERFGLQGGNILEPSMGVGAFFANRPASFDESAHLFGVEIDPVTARIAKQLYPKANIQICGYEKAALPDSYFDVVIGNVPFGQYKVNDPAFNRYNFLIHDYFAAKSIDKLRVGGIQAIITTSGTMDKQSEDVRKYLAARCELIGAVRLPNTAFKALAGTEVTADILFLQKRDHVVDQDVSWLHTGTNADGIPMNQYFIDHPEMICGKMEMVSGPYGMRPTCQPDTSTTLEEQLQAAMGRLNATLVKTEPIILEQPGEISPLPADPDIRNYSYGIRDDKIFFRTDSVMREVTANATAQARIAYIHDANTDAKKATLFAKMRAGKVRILMGSTKKMGAGTNVQTKLIALHHLDVPWRPSDIEQREGRILRQGNENPTVQIYRYATEGSFDAYSWQLIEQKQKFISQIMTSKSPARSCQDLDEIALSYAEIKALCAGNPLIKEKMELDNEVARLSTLRSSHMSQIFELQDKIAIGYPASIQKVEESLDAVSKDIDVYRANSRFNPDGSEKFSAIVMGTTYTERKAADAALRDALQGATAGDVIIGQYRGFNIHAYYDAKAVSFMGYLQGEQKYNFEFNPKENFSSFRHLLEKLSDTQAQDQELLTALNKNLEDAKEAVNQPFAYEKEFQTKLARLNELNTILNQEGGKTDVHPEIQELQAKIDQTYAAMAADPQKYLEYLNFRGQCVGMGVENSVAVFAQNPKATYCPSPEAIGSPKVKPGEEDRSISVLRTDGIERVYALEQYDLPESEYLDKAPLQWTEAQHSDLIHRVEDAAQLADISVLSDLRHGTGFFDASRNVIHIREGNNSTEQLKSLLEGYSEAVITRTSTSDKPVAELESAALTALLQVRCGVPIDEQLTERITAALEDAGNVGGFSMRDSVARLHNAMEYCVRYAELEQTSEQYQAQQIEPEELTPQSEAFMEMM